MHVANFPPQGARIGVRQLACRAETGEALTKALGAGGDRGRRPLEPHDGGGIGAGDPRNPGSLGEGLWQMGRGGDLPGPGKRLGHGGERRPIVEARDHDGAAVLGRRQDLEGHLGHHRKGPERARQQLGHVVAGDVLHHPAAGLEGFAPSADGLDAEDMIARGAGGDPPRP